MIVFYIADGDGNKNRNSMARLIKSNGKEILMFPENEGVFKLREVQEVIGGDVEILPIEIDSVMIIHKDCELKHLTFNKRATDIAFQNNVFRCIIGDVLICASEEIE